MLPELSAVSAAQDGVFTRTQALAAGYTAAEVRARLRSGRWVRLDRGRYAPDDALQPLDAVERHRRTARAVLLPAWSSDAASHATAALVHGLPLLGPPPDAVHVTGPGPSRRRAGLVCHRAALTPAEVTVVDGIPVTTLARTVVDLSRTLPGRNAVVVADAALGRGLRRDELQEQLLRRPAVPGIRRAGRVARFADPGAESPGESLSRVAMAAHGLPVPQLQAVLADAEGFVARVDFLFRDRRTVGEFDGALKYGDRAVLLAEKGREDRIRGLGLQVVRWGWDAAYGDFGPVARRLWAAFDRAGRHRSP